MMNQSARPIGTFFIEAAFNQEKALYSRSLFCDCESDGSFVALMNTARPALSPLLACDCPDSVSRHCVPGPGGDLDCDWPTKKVLDKRGRPVSRIFRLMTVYCTLVMHYETAVKWTAIRSIVHFLSCI